MSGEIMNIKQSGDEFEKRALEAAIRISVVAVLVVWTYQIVKPFLMPVIWGIIIAVAVEPFIARCVHIAGGRRKLVASLFALVVVLALIVPVVMLSASSYDAVMPLLKGLEHREMSVPTLPASVAQWPFAGPYISKAWTHLSTNLGGAIKQFAPQLKTAAGYLLGSVGGGVRAVFMFIVSIIIAGAILATAEGGTATARRIMRRFARERGDDILELATATIRGVMLGVVGVAIIQSVLSALGLIVAGIPVPGLWAVLVLVCAVIQLPPILVLGPVAAWYFSVADTTPAVIFLVWSILVSSSDSVLKPVLMGRGVNIPMLVILVGALGGMMLSGIIGLFIGAVIVAISYELFMAWIKEEAEETA